MNELNHTSLETKIAQLPPNDPALRDSHDDFRRTYEEFRETNDRRLGELERRFSSDVVTRDKLDRLNQALDDQKKLIDELQLKSLRPSLEAPSRKDRVESPEHRRAFESYVRKGDLNQLISLEHKALSAGSAPDGGYLVPEETERSIGKLLAEASPIRSIAGVRQVSAAIYKKPIAVTGAATGWVAETAARPQTASPTLAELQFPAMEIYAMPAATQTLLDDAVVDIDQWLAEEVREAFAEQETDAFVNGDGLTRPKGFLAYDKTADQAWSWGSIGFLATGAAGGFAAENPADVLVDLVYALKSGYRQNARFVMNRKTQAELRKLKDSSGDYLWQPAQSLGTEATIMNFPVTEAEAMPDIADGAYALAFGDFRRAYLIVDRLGVRILRDPFTAKPYVLFYTTKRVGGGVQNFEALKLLKFAAA